MDCKILKPKGDRPNILLSRWVSDKGEPCVEIRAIGFWENEHHQAVNEIIVFKDHESAECFIDDYSIKSAEIWVENNGIYFSDGQHE